MIDARSPSIYIDVHERCGGKGHSDGGGGGGSGPGDGLGGGRGVAGSGRGAGGVAGRQCPVQGLVVARYREGAGRDQAGHALQACRPPSGRAMMAKMPQGGPSPAALAVSRLAESERVRLGHPYLGDEHLLLGVLANASNGVAVLLTERGLDLATARAGIARLAEQAGPVVRDDAAVLREFGI